MNEHKLIIMANQIAGFFQSMPNRAEAISGFVNHIHSTWEPRMQQALKHHIDTCGDAGLSTLAKEALPQLFMPKAS